MNTTERTSTRRPRQASWSCRSTAARLGLGLLLAACAAGCRGGCGGAVPPAGRDGARRDAAAASCEGATQTPASSSTLRADVAVTELAVAASPRGAVVLAVAGGRLHAARVGAGELRRVSAGVQEGDAESDPDVVASGDGFAAAWRRTRGEASFLVTARLRPDGALDGSERVEQLDAGRPGVAIASSPTALAVAYVTEGAVGVRLLRTSGEPAGLPVLLPGSTGARAPSITWAGASFLVSWTSPTGERGTITIAQLDPNSGDVRPLSALAARSAAARSTVAAGGGRIALAWSDPPRTGAVAGDGGEPAAAAEVFSTEFETTGVRLTTPRPHGGGGVAAAPALVWTGGGFALSWTEAAAGGARRVRWAALPAPGDGDGDGDGEARALTVRGSEGTAAGAARLAWDGEAFVLVRSGGAPNEVAVHRFGPRGCDPR